MKCIKIIYMYSKTNNKNDKMSKTNGNKHFFSAFVIAVCVLMSKATGVIRDIFFAKYLALFSQY